MKKKTWKTYVKTLSVKQKEKMLMVLLDHLMEPHQELLSYREGGLAEFPDEPPSKECIYWSSCGEDILKL